MAKYAFHPNLTDSDDDTRVANTRVISRVSKIEIDCMRSVSRNLGCSNFSRWRAQSLGLEMPKLAGDGHDGGSGSRGAIRRPRAI